MQSLLKTQLYLDSSNSSLPPKKSGWSLCDSRFQNIFQSNISSQKSESEIYLYIILIRRSMRPLSPIWGIQNKTGFSIKIVSLNDMVFWSVKTAANNPIVTIPAYKSNSWELVAILWLFLPLFLQEHLWRGLTVKSFTKVQHYIYLCNV